MIGILYESNEWSDHKLASELEARGLPVTMINMEEPDYETRAYASELLVSRVFASGMFRGHELSHQRMPELLEQAKHRKIRVVNPSEAHFFEISKLVATRRLAQEGFLVPQIYACGFPEDCNEQDFVYPCVIKPNCGGRTTYTTIAHTPSEARSFLDSVPHMEFIIEEYLEPEKGFLTRVEIINANCALVVQRSVVANGLSSFHQGSTFARYDNPSKPLLRDCVDAANTLSFELGSFDVIERGQNYYFIDANSVSNCQKDFASKVDFDLMSAYADYIATL